MTGAAVGCAIRHRSASAPSSPGRPRTVGTCHGGGPGTRGRCWSARSCWPQTQVARVVPNGRRSSQRWPDPASCAAAPVGEVIAAWNGLGYNRRAATAAPRRLCHRRAPRRDGPGRPRRSAGSARVSGPYTARAVHGLRLRSARRRGRHQRRPGVGPRRGRPPPHPGPRRSGWPTGPVPPGRGVGVESGHARPRRPVGARARRPSCLVVPTRTVRRGPALHVGRPGRCPTRRRWFGRDVATAVTVRRLRPPGQRPAGGGAGLVAGDWPSTRTRSRPGPVGPTIRPAGRRCGPRLMADGLVAMGPDGELRLP